MSLSEHKKRLVNFQGTFYRIKESWQNQGELNQFLTLWFD